MKAVKKKTLQSTKLKISLFNDPKKKMFSGMVKN